MTDEKTPKETARQDTAFGASIGYKPPLFFVGLHMPNHAPRFDRCMVSVNRLRNRKSDFGPKQWMMDSGAFSELERHHHYRHSVKEYAQQINRWAKCGDFKVAVSQDYMCEPYILGLTGLTVIDHQRLTIERYDELLQYAEAPIMPVLQGYKPEEYVRHIEQYGERLPFGAWVGVGSVCKRNGNPRAIELVLMAIHRKRPDLRLHGFGIKETSLGSGIVKRLLYSCDSLAWSYAGRREKVQRQNDPTKAEEFVASIQGKRAQDVLFLS